MIIYTYDTYDTNAQAIVFENKFENLKHLLPSDLQCCYRRRRVHYCRYVCDVII